MANESRGTHSTGIGLIDKDAVVLKRAQKATSFVTEDIIKKALKMPARIMLGHTRAATMGAINDDNAHPFQEGTIIGAHNGIITNHADLDKSVNVDSQAVIRALDSEKNDYKKAFAMTQGSCALTWVDMRDPNVLHLVSHINPLAVAKISEIDTIFWSSEIEDLRIVLTAVFGSGFFAFVLKSDKVYKISSHLQITGDEVEFKKYTTYYDDLYRDMAKKKRLKRIIDGDFEDEERSCSLSEKSEQLEIRKLIGDGKNNVRILKYSDFDEEDWVDLLTRAEEEGCALCQDPMQYGLYLDEEDGSLICSECFYKNKEMQSYFQFVDFGMD